MGGMDTPENKNVVGVPSAPPAPQEVKVRTMKSDLASIAASGGGLPQFQNVQLAPANTNNTNRNLLTILVSIVVVVLALAVVYFGYLALQKQQAAQNPATNSQQ
jgi:hypothetical protein